MKKAYIICLAMVIAIPVFAQKGIQISIFGGPQSVWMFNKNDLHDPFLKYRATFKGFVGTEIGYKFNTHSGIDMELLYSWQGQNFDNAYFNSVEHRNLVYFKMPVLYDYNSNPGKKVVFTTKVGPYIGINIAAKSDPYQPDFLVNDADTYTSNSFVASPWYGQGYQRNIKMATIGVIWAVGMDVNITQQLAINAGLRFDGDLTGAIIDRPDYAYFTTAYYHNGNNEYGRKKTWNVTGGIEVGVKYTIPVGKKKE